MHVYSVKTYIEENWVIFSPFNFSQPAHSHSALLLYIRSKQT